MDAHLIKHLNVQMVNVLINNLNVIKHKWTIHNLYAIKLLDKNIFVQMVHAQQINHNAIMLMVVLMNHHKDVLQEHVSIQI
jgi:hypothetical protein